ncbi:DUF2339 domain-containing protein [Archangium lansingense]|uniref:DUF2339 domain-containing protein n=1 Tax=Archangium lansingense TaxID=2995310 RepID=A0ABT4A1H4_9BACT|nr:DUF2339 domain-containing protein [Archangium lansinium]MCY1075475.1 DUF2339 domain-containing protein [Archangium lansinium]
MNATMSTKWDVRVMAVAGAGMLGLAGVFLWRDLQVPHELLLAVAAVLASTVALAEVPRERPLVGPIALLTTGLMGGLWYAAAKSGLLLVGLGLTVLASVITVARTWRRTEAREDKLQGCLLWYGLTVAVIATSWSFYFHFFTLGFAADDISRRLVLTLGWLAAGVGLVVYGRMRDESVIRDAGFAFIAMALGKALAYDTTHLSGTLRVACLAVAGALMLGGAWLSSHRTARSA